MEDWNKEDEFSIHTKKGREYGVNNGEMDPWEEAFLEGEEEAANEGFD